MPERPHRLDPAAPDLSRENRPEPAPPEPNRLMRDIGPALVQRVLDVPQRQRVADIQHHRQADDLGARLEGAKNAGVAPVIEGSDSGLGGKPIFIWRCPTAYL
jgi:hypothetical protein